MPDVPGMQARGVERVQVKSSSLLAVGYDPQARVLEVEFVSGAVYRYDDVDADEHAGLLRAESKGRYFNANIRDRHPHRRL